MRILATPLSLSFPGKGGRRHGNKKDNRNKSGKKLQNNCEEHMDHTWVRLYCTSVHSHSTGDEEFLGRNNTATIVQQYWRGMEKPNTWCVSQKKLIYTVRIIALTILIAKASQRCNKVNKPRSKRYCYARFDKKSCRQPGASWETHPIRTPPWMTSWIRSSGGVESGRAIFTKKVSSYKNKRINRRALIFFIEPRQRRSLMVFTETVAFKTVSYKKLATFVRDTNIHPPGIM